jgi:two-component system, NarL family, invasion response regulator UvrY
MHAPTVGVMTVDDQPAFRQVAREVVEATVGFVHVGDASCGEEALALAGEVGPDLVFVDMCMPGIDGLETARRLKASHPTATIVLISAEGFEGDPSRVESCGAAAFLRKEDFRPSMLRRLWDEHGRRLTPGATD